MNIQQYKPNSKLTREQLLENNFRYTDGCYLYRFPVYKYKKDITIWGIFIIDLETRSCDIAVVNSSFVTYAAYYNRTYGYNDSVVEAIDNRIEIQIKQFLKDKIIFKRRSKRRSK